MIKKIQEHTYRISKECPPFLLLIFYQEGEELLRLKAIDHPQQTSLNQQRLCYSKDFVYSEMPDLIRHNYASLREIFEEIQVTSRSCFKFDPQVGLRIGLQVGSKVRYCIFYLEPSEHSYLESVEKLLWQAEGEAQRANPPDQVYLNQLRILRAINERHTQLITQLEAKLKTEQQERHKCEKQIQALNNLIAQMSAEMYELRLLKDADESEMESEEPPRAEQSSLICEEQKSPVQFINLEEDNSWITAIERHNGIAGINRFRFKLDVNAGCDRDNSFQRLRQRITYKRRDEKHRHFTSLVALPQPIGLVSFRLLKTKEHNIYVGVALFERTKDSSTTRDGEAISYKLSGEGLWEDKVRAKVATDRININEILTLFINGRRKVIQWWNGSKLITERVLPLCFQMHQAFPFVNMIHEGDCVEFL